MQQIITSAGDISGTAANKFGTYYDKTTQDYTYYNIYQFLLPSNSTYCGELIILPYMDLNACDEPIDDTTRKIALIFYVENPTVQPTYLPLSIACRNQSGRIFLFLLTKYPNAPSSMYVVAQSSFDRILLPYP
jgi:hypothetical protein